MDRFISLHQKWLFPVMASPNSPRIDFCFPASRCWSEHLSCRWEDAVRYCKHELPFHANDGFYSMSHMTWLRYDWHWLWKLIFMFISSWFESINPFPFGFNCWHLRFLQRARPTWSPKDLHAAKEKLEAVHVNSTQQLKELLRQRRLNDICLEDVVGDVRVCVCIDTSEFWWMRVWREIRSRSSLSQKPHFFFRSRVGRGGASL